MDKNDTKKRVNTEEDFVHSPRFGNSLRRFLIKNSDGVDNATIAKVLMMTEEEVERLYEEAINELREEMVEG